MANSKLSALSATTTVDDDDLFYVADGGAAEKKITGASLKAAVAPVDAKYIVQQASAGLSAEQATGALATGILKNTTTTGVLSIAAGADLPTGIPIASLADPTTGKVIGSAGSAAAAVFPPGYQFDYVERTTALTPTATTEGTAEAFVTGNSVTYDGSTVIRIEFFCPYVNLAAGATGVAVLYDGASSIGKLAATTAPAGAGMDSSFGTSGRVVTPSAAAHVYSIRVYRITAAPAFTAGAGGNGNYMPAYIRQIKVS